MRHSGEPHRQCIGCRSVRPKKELIRLVLIPSGQTVFDAMHTVKGRGIYLCPDGMCFQRAYKNKRWMKYFHDKDNLRELFDSIGKALRKNIKRYFALGTRMKLLRIIHKEVDHLSKDDLIIISRDLSPEKKKNVLAAAREIGAAVVDVPQDCMQEAATHVMKEDFPLISQLRKDLRVYERLSSKGLAI